MTSYKKISFAFALSMLFQLTNCAQNSNINSALDLLKEKYEYNIDEKTAPIHAQDKAPTVIYDKTKSHWFDTGLTHTIVTREIKNGVIITKTEKYTTRHSSYVTWMNAMLVMIISSNISGSATNKLISDISRKLPGLKNKSLAELTKYFGELTAKEKARHLTTSMQTAVQSPNLPIIGTFTGIGMYASFVACTVFLSYMYQYLTGQEKFNKKIVEKETNVLARELKALADKELEILAQEEPQL